MSNNKGSQKTQRQGKNKSNNNEKPSSLIQYIPLITAIVAALALIIVAIINRSTALLTTLTPIEFTQTAEAFHTSVAATQTMAASETFISSTQTAKAFGAAITLTQHANASETKTSLALTQAANVLETSVGATNQAVLTQNALPLTEIKPVRYEYTFEKGDTLEEISIKFLLTNFFADAIGKANCNRSPNVGDVLVIRYYNVQQGDTIDLLAERYGGSVNFLRSINNLSDAVVFLPAGQVFILPGKCGGS
jgi:LysM repeat protein